jgi:hypothetical protein
MKAWLGRLRAIGEDWLRYHPIVRNRLAGWRRWREGRHAPRNHQERARAIHSLCAAARLTDSAVAVERISQRIHEHLRSLDPREVDWRSFVSDLSPRLGMSELIKAPAGTGEKGVLFLAFEHEWIRIMVHADLEELARRYHLVLGPSSSPYNLVNYVFPAALAAPPFTLISNRRDMDALPRICPRFIVVPLFASSWVDPERFTPLPRHERDIDLIMVANFAKVKRHHALFRALRRMPSSLRVHLIGQDSEGRNPDTIRELASHFGVAGRFTLRADAPYPEVARSLCRARASVILSRREGSCVVIAESLFADTPAALLRGAEIGSSAFINEQTGRFLDESKLAEQLTEFIAETDRYQPRAWAEANISSRHSVRVLNETIKRHALAAGESWASDLRPFTWCPFPRLISSADREALAPARREFHERFGLTIGPAEPCRATAAVELATQTSGV